MRQGPLDLAPVHASIVRYYTGKVTTHGPTPLGVDWSCMPTQELRFVQLLNLCDWTVPFSLNDLGCGYGALLAFIGKRFAQAPVDYVGIDLSPAMVSQALRLWDGHYGATFSVGSAAPRVADYTVASGIFNVKLDHDEQAWEGFIATTLQEMRAASRCGFAVNFLRPVEPGSTGAPQLYRAPPARWQDFCERLPGVKVTVVADYGMREYTLLARIDK